MKPSASEHKRLLIIDGDPVMLEWLHAALRDLLRVEIALGGRAGLDRLRRAPRPDLIILAEALPDLAGVDVLRMVRSQERTHRVPVVIAADALDDDAQADWANRGATEYLHKPYRLAEVEARVLALLRAQALEHQAELHALVLDERVRERTRALEAEVKQRRQTEERFTYHLYHHPVTTLPNRLLLQERLRHHARAAERQPFALLLLALQGFHEINNTLGYETGSHLLREVALRLNELAAATPGVLPIEAEPSPRHYIASVAGVNLGLILDARGDDAELSSTARSVLQVLEAPFELEGVALTVGAQAGIARCTGAGCSPDVVLRHAHIAVEEAAASGKRIVFYSDSINRYSARRLSLMGELHTAIQHDTLQLAFQPQLHLQHGRIASVEALLRWQHPKLGFVRPDEFVPLAEQGGSIKTLTAWVLRAAVRQCRTFMDRKLPLGVSVNLSARNLHEPDLAQQIMDLLREYRVPPERLLLEVTETAVMKGRDAAMRTLGQLHGHGVHSAIDDFGTGYSSLGYLKSLPVSEVKIDRSFVKDMVQSANDQIIVQTIIDMGHNLGLRVVAEGVEDGSVLERLQLMGCDMAQGYHLGRPMFSTALLDWLEQAPYPVTAASDCPRPA